MGERIRIKDIAERANLSVGTVDRVIHGRSGVSKKSRMRVEEILKEMNYQPNMYASALASNKSYRFACLLPQHEEGEYWTEVQNGIYEAMANFGDFNINISLSHYDPYNYASFVQESRRLVDEQYDGILFAPTLPAYTKPFTDALKQQGTPYIYIDSNIVEEPALAFYGQNSVQSGYFAASILMMSGQSPQEVVIFRKKYEGIIGSNQQERREVGFRRYMQTYHPQCQILELDLHVMNEADDMAMLNQFFQTHPNVKNGITFNSKAYIVGEFLQREKMEYFNLIGYDLLQRNVDCLKQGGIHFLIAQHPRLQGYSGIQSLCEHLILKKSVNPINYMPIDLLTKENIAYYNIR